MKTQSKEIITECYVDTEIIATIVGKKYVNHQKGANNVAKIMKKNFSDRFAIAVVDQDKRKDSYWTDFEVIKEQKNFKFLKHKQKHHYLFFIKPAAEVFLMESAKQIDYQGDYFNSLEKLKTKTKTSVLGTEIKEEIKKLSISDNFQELKKILLKLIEQKYNFTLNN